MTQGTYRNTTRNTTRPPSRSARSTASPRRRESQRSTTLRAELIVRASVPNLVMIKLQGKALLTMDVGRALDFCEPLGQLVGANPTEIVCSLTASRGDLDGLSFRWTARDGSYVVLVRHRGRVVHTFSPTAFSRFYARFVACAHGRVDPLQPS